MTTDGEDDDIDDDDGEARRVETSLEQNMSSEGACPYNHLSACVF